MSQKLTFSPTSNYSSNQIIEGEKTPQKNQTRTQDTISLTKDGILPCIQYSLSNLSDWVAYGLKTVFHTTKEKINVEKLIGELENANWSRQEKIEWLLSMIQPGIEQPSLYKQDVIRIIALFAEKAPNEFNLLADYLRKEEVTQGKISETLTSILEWVSAEGQLAFLALSQAGQNLLKTVYYLPEKINGVKNLNNPLSKRIGNLYGLFEENYQKKLHEKSFVREIVQDHIGLLGQCSLANALAKEIKTENLIHWIKSDKFNYEFLLLCLKKTFLSTIYSKIADSNEDKIVKLGLLEFLLCFVSIGVKRDDSFSVKNTLSFFVEKNWDLFALISDQVGPEGSIRMQWSYTQEWLITDRSEKTLVILRQSIQKTIHFLTKENFCSNTKKAERTLLLVKNDIYSLLAYCNKKIRHNFPSEYLVEMFIAFIEHNKVSFRQIAKCILLGQQGESCRWKSLAKSLTDKIEDHYLHPKRRAEKEDAKRCQLTKFLYGGALSQYISSGRHDQMMEEAYVDFLKEYISSYERNWEFLMDGMEIWLQENRTI